MEESVEKIVEEILKETDADREEIIEKIEEKKDELSGFITPEGAATIVARNYGITPEREEPEVQKLKIEDLSEGMSNVDIVGIVERTFEPREFDRKDGGKGKVANIILKDDTGEIRTVLWGKMANLIGESEIQKGEILRLKGAYIKKGRNESPELNVGRRAEIEIDPMDERTEELPSVTDSKAKISELDPDSQFVDLVGRVIAVTEPREFERSNGSTGTVSTLRVVDETGQIRVSMWDEKAKKAEEIDQGDVIRLENASIRVGRQEKPELHLNWRGRVVKNPSLEDTEDLPEFKKKLLKIEEIEPDMSILDLAARVQRTYPPNEFTRDDGSKSRVMSVILADETGTIRASFWGDMVEVGQKLTNGDAVLIENARSRIGLQDRPEVQVGSQTSVKINPEDVEIEKEKPRRIKISELEEGMDSIETVGRIMESSEIREFTRSDGSEGKAASLTIGDETGTVQVTLWDSKTDILEELEVGDVVKVCDSYTVSGDYGQVEIHISERGEIEINPDIDENIPKTEDIHKSKTEKKQLEIGDVEENSQVKIRGTVVRLFQRNPIFKVCPKCNHNIRSDDSEVLCEKCGETIEPEPRAVLNMVLDDGTENIRVVVFGELVEKLLGKTPEEIMKELEGKELEDFYNSLDLEGAEIAVSGRVKRDDYYDQLEIRASNVSFPDPEEETRKILEQIKS